MSTGSLGSVWTEFRLRMDQLRGDIDSATADLRRGSTAMERISQETSRRMRESMHSVTDSMKEVGMAATAAGAAIAVGLGMAVKTAADFEAKMSKVQAVSGSTTEELAQMRKQAMELGSSTSFSASEAAEGMQLLASAGMDANKIMGAMPGVLDAAAASGEDLALVAETMGTILNTFNLAATESGHVADVLAKSANLSAIGVKDIAESMKYVAPVAAQLGMTVDEVGAALIEQGNAGIKGSEAGTALRSSLLSLISPSDAAATTMEQLGIKIIDSSGKMLPFSNVLEQLKTKMADMSEAQKAAALATIFGKEAVSSMLVLVGQGGAKFDEFTAALKNANGSAAETAKIMDNNLSGSLDQLSGAVETIMISVGTALIPFVRLVADTLSVLANAFNALPGPVQSAIAIFSLMAAAALLLGGGLLMLIGFIPSIMAGFAALGVTGATITGIFGTMWAVVTGPVAIVIAVIAAIVAAGYMLYKHWDDVKKYGVEAWKAMGKGISAAWCVIKGVFSKIPDSIKEIIGYFADLPDKIGGALSDAAQWVADTMGAMLQSITDVGAGIINWFTDLPVKVVSFLQMIAKEGPYWIGYAIGRMLRIVIDTGSDIIQWFAELPGRIVTFISDMANQAVATWDNLKTTTVTTVQNMINGVIDFFTQLPGRVVAFVTETVDSVDAAWTSISSTMTTAASDAVTGTINFFAQLPGRTWTFLVATYNRVVEFGANAVAQARKAGSDMVDGIISFLSGLPGRVYKVFTDCVDKIVSTAGEWRKAAKNAASQAWEGFKDGLGIHSPSYIEEALFKIMDTSKMTVGDLMKDFNRISSMTVTPDFAPAFGVAGTGSVSGRAVNQTANTNGYSNSTADSLKGNVNNTNINLMILDDQDITKLHRKLKTAGLMEGVRA